jgi:hypothetical protein
MVMNGSAAAAPPVAAASLSKKSDTSLVPLQLDPE